MRSPCFYLSKARLKNTYFLTSDSHNGSNDRKYARNDSLIEENGSISMIMVFVQVGQGLRK